MKNNDKDGTFNNAVVEKSEPLTISEIIEYLPNAVMTKTILKKITGNVTIMSFDNGKGLEVRTSAFDTFAHVVEGKAEIVIDNVSNHLEKGMGIIIPAHLPNFIRPNGRFKLVQTIIKSGYEE